MALHAETVTVLHVEHGEPDESGVAPEVVVEYDIPGCNVQPLGTEEDPGQVGVITGRLRVSTRVGDVREALEPYDRIRYRGVVHEIVGYPGHFRAVRPHTEFTIAKIGG